MKNMLWLDLEGTVIESGMNPVFLSENIEKIKEMISKESFNSFGIFSFLIDDEFDVEKNIHIIKAVESLFTIKFDFIFFKQMLMPIFKKKFGQNFDELDFIDFTRSKEDCFHMFCRDNFTNANMTLIDDKVEDVDIFIRKTNLHLTTLNIAI